MYIVIGGTGNVGSGVAQALLDAGQPTIIVTRDAAEASAWRAKGAELAECDIRNTARLREVLARGRRAFLLNPPADPSTDTNKVELETVACLIEGLKGSGLEMVVAQSTMGARRGGPCGDLNVLYDLEQQLAAQPIPARVVRAGYHFANWDTSIDMAREGGWVDSPLPLDKLLPMASTTDIGRRCAQLLQGPVGRSVEAVEGPARYTAREAIALIGKALGQDVEAKQVERSDLEEWFRNAGFSSPAAKSYSCMTRTLWDEDQDENVPVYRGSATLEKYLQQAAAKWPAMGT